MKGQVGDSAGALPGPISIPRKVKVNASDANMEKNPLIAALKLRFAQQLAEAQNLVQEAYLAPGADVIYGSPWQSIAMAKRGDMRTKAAEEYNRGLDRVPAEPFKMRQYKDIAPNPFYGA